jgi:hypothetical protein
LLAAAAVVVVAVVLAAAAMPFPLPVPARSAVAAAVYPSSSSIARTAHRSSTAVSDAASCPPSSSSSPSALDAAAHGGRQLSNRPGCDAAALWLAELAALSLAALASAAALSAGGAAAAVAMRWSRRRRGGPSAGGAPAGGGGPGGGGRPARDGRGCEPGAPREERRAPAPLPPRPAPPRPEMALSRCRGPRRPRGSAAPRAPERLGASLLRFRLGWPWLPPGLGTVGASPTETTGTRRGGMGRHVEPPASVQPALCRAAGPNAEPGGGKKAVLPPLVSSPSPDFPATICRSADAAAGESEPTSSSSAGRPDAASFVLLLLLHPRDGAYELLAVRSAGAGCLSSLALRDLLDAGMASARHPSFRPPRPESLRWKQQGVAAAVLGRDGAPRLPPLPARSPHPRDPCLTKSKSATSQRPAKSASWPPGAGCRSLRPGDVLVGLVGGDALDPATLKGVLRKAAKILQQDPVRGALRKVHQQQHKEEEDAPLPSRARAAKAEAAAPAVTAAPALEGPSTKAACRKGGLPLVAVTPPQGRPSPARLADKWTAGGSENVFDPGAPAGQPVDVARPSRPPLAERRLSGSESCSLRRRQGPGPEGSRRGGAGKENARPRARSPRRNALRDDGEREAARGSDR